jgi:hypothetical protein
MKAIGMDVEGIISLGPGGREAGHRETFSTKMQPHLESSV